MTHDGIFVPSSRSPEQSAGGDLQVARRQVTAIRSGYPSFDPKLPQEGVP